MIQLRNVPDALHRGLKARAAMAGMSLSDYLLAEIKEIAERPTLSELRERLHKRKPVSVPLDTARMVREEREARAERATTRKHTASEAQVAVKPRRPILPRNWFAIRQGQPVKAAVRPGLCLLC